MKIHTYIICYNEEYIIKNILDYYNKISTKIFLLDNLSTDNTLKIARQYKNVTIIPFDTGGVKNNAMHVSLKSQLYKEHSRKGGVHTKEVADWVICVDTDEVVYHPDLINVLKEYKKLGITVPQITGFHMTGKEELDSTKPIVEQYMFGSRDDVFDKTAVFDPNFDMSYTKGCHPYGHGFHHMKDTINYKSSNDFPIALLHYKDIGGLLYESSVKNLSRFENIKQRADGTYFGEGAHYAIFEEKGKGFSPFSKKKKLVLNKDYRVNFHDFPSSNSDKGTKENNTNSKVIDDIQINKIRDMAMKYAGSDIKLALSLMTLAGEFRPEGTGIIKKIEQYKELLKNNSK
ncbi:MAG: glycosyltransferase family 2 protein [Colwellia sp.]|nr:glycosyltransferase family 2 protein [Colwellia sp.]